MNQDEINPNADVIEGEVVETLTDATETAEETLDAPNTDELPTISTENDEA